MYESLSKLSQFMPKDPKPPDGAAKGVRRHSVGPLEAGPPPLMTLATLANGPPSLVAHQPTNPYVTNFKPQGLAVLDLNKASTNSASQGLAAPDLNEPDQLGSQPSFVLSKDLGRTTLTSNDSSSEGSDLEVLVSMPLLHQPSYKGHPVLSAQGHDCSKATALELEGTVSKPASAPPSQISKGTPSAFWYKKPQLPEARTAAKIKPPRAGKLSKSKAQINLAACSFGEEKSQEKLTSYSRKNENENLLVPRPTRPPPPRPIDLDEEIFQLASTHNGAAQATSEPPKSNSGRARLSKGKPIHFKKLYEFTDDEESFWESLCTSRAAFFSMKPTEQGSFEYANKIQVRKILENADKVLKRRALSGQVASRSKVLARQDDMRALESELLVAILGMKSSFQWELAYRLAISKTDKCVQCNDPIVPNQCTCREDEYVHYMSLIEALQARSPLRLDVYEPPLYPKVQGLTREELTRHLSEVPLNSWSMDQLDLTLAATAAGMLQSTQDQLDVHYSEDKQAALHQSVEELKERISLAKVIIQPYQQDPIESNRWIKAIGLARIAAEGLGLDPRSEIIYRSTGRITKVYLKVISGLSYYHADKGTSPDWELIGQLLVDGFEATSSKDMQYASMTSVLAKALPKTSGAIAQLKLWNPPPIMLAPGHFKLPPEPEEDPIAALNRLLNSKGPVSVWELNPYDHSTIEYIEILETASELATSVSWELHRYLDNFAGVDKSHPSARQLEYQAMGRLLRGFKYQCKKINWFARTGIAKLDVPPGELPWEDENKTVNATHV